MSAVVAKLLEQGFEDVEDQGRNILIAALEGNYIGVLELILQSDKIHKAVHDSEGRTPLLAVVQAKSSAAVRMLLDRRDIDLISRSEFGYTLFTLALNMGSRELMQAFLDSGRLPDACDSEDSRGHKFAAFLRWAYRKSGFMVEFLARIGYTQHSMQEKEDTRKHCSNVRRIDPNHLKIPRTAPLMPTCQYGWIT